MQSYKTKLERSPTNSLHPVHKMSPCVSTYSASPSLPSKLPKTGDTTKRNAASRRVLPATRVVTPSTDDVESVPHLSHDKISLQGSGTAASISPVASTKPADSHGETTSTTRNEISSTPATI